MEKVKHVVKKTFFWCGGITGITGLLLAVLFEKGIYTAIGFVMMFVGGLFVVAFVVTTIGDGEVKAFWDQRKYGGFKGLWKSKNLSGELKRNFKTAHKVKIKVTRGSELFNDKRSGNIKKYLEELRDSASQEREVYCEILLIAPCYKLRHVKERHEKSKKEYPQPEDFLKSWYDKTIYEVDNLEREKSNTHFHIEVRFYSGRHSQWRFYIFESMDRAIKTVLFSDYDLYNREHGIELPMYKVLENDHNIGGFMERYFDEIWESALTREGFREAVATKKCARKFCEECDVATANVSSCQLSECPIDTCEYAEYCAKYVKAYL